MLYISKGDHAMLNKIIYDLPKTKNTPNILSKNVTHKTLEERTTEYNRKLGPYTEYDWGKPQGREVW